MKADAGDDDVSLVEEKLTALGKQCNISRGIQRTVIGAIGDERDIDDEALEAMPGVERVVRVMKPYKIVSRESHGENTVVDVSGIPVGGNTIQMPPPVAA